MTEMNMNGFVEMSQDEMMDVNGGFGVTITAALIAGGVALFSAGFAGGIAVGLNRKNRK